MQRFRRLIRPLVLLCSLLLAGAHTTQAQLGKLSKPVGMVRGEVTSKDGQALGGISVTILRGTERVSTTKTTPDGKFSMVLNPGATFRVIINEANYLYHEDTLVIPALTAYQEYPVHVTLVALRDGESLTPETPVFQAGSAKIEAAALARIGELADLLRHNLRLVIAVTVYPDQVINDPKRDAAQVRLADARAGAIRDLFTQHGVLAGRYTFTKATSVPAGRFPVAGQASAAPAKKKGKGAGGASGKMLPQYAEFVAQISGK